MEQLPSNYTGSVPVLNSDRPNSSHSVIDRIRQITKSVLAKMDELYPKFGPSVYVAGFIGLAIAAALPEAYFAAACVLGVSSILGLGVDLYLGSRQEAYLCNKLISKNKDLQMQLRSIQKEMNIAKLMEPINQSQSKEEFAVASTKIVASHLKKVQKTISDAYVQYKSSAEQSFSHEVHFRGCFDRILTYLEQPELFDPITLCARITIDIEEAFDSAEKSISHSIAFFEKKLKEMS
jgi:hypothetical protein